MADEIYSDKKKQEVNDRILDSIQEQLEVQQASDADKPQPTPNPPTPPKPKTIPSPGTHKPRIVTGDKN